MQFWNLKPWAVAILSVAVWGGETRGQLVWSGQGHLEGTVTVTGVDTDSGGGDGTDIGISLNADTDPGPGVPVCPCYQLTSNIRIQRFGWLISLYGDMRAGYEPGQSSNPGGSGEGHLLATIDFEMPAGGAESISVDLNKIFNEVLVVVDPRVVVENVTQSLTLLDLTTENLTSVSLDDADAGDLIRITLTMDHMHTVPANSFERDSYWRCWIEVRLPDCNGNNEWDEDDIAQGTSADCNGNLQPDECDVADGTSEDCSGNGILDECEPDCNNTGLADSCDIFDGTSEDCNENGIPDDCEVDCNSNLVTDFCDIRDGTSEDCNENEIPDECDLANGFEDANGNEIPDVCEAPPAPQVGDALLKSRFLTILPPVDEEATIKVTVLEMPQYPEREGDSWWVGPEVVINNSPNADLRGAPLECTTTPHSQVWTDGPLHLFGEAIIPSPTSPKTRYEVRSCNALGTACSLPLVVETGKMGDAVSPFGGCCQPNFSDINAHVTKFQGKLLAPDIVFVDQRSAVGGAVDLVADFADVLACVAGFSQQPYPFAVPACAP